MDAKGKRPGGNRGVREAYVRLHPSKGMKLNPLSITHGLVHVRRVLPVVLRKLRRWEAA